MLDPWNVNWNVHTFKELIPSRAYQRSRADSRLCFRLFRGPNKIGTLLSAKKRSLESLTPGRPKFNGGAKAAQRPGAA